MISVERKACFHVANASLSRLKLIELVSMLKVPTMIKKYVFCQNSGRQWVSKNQAHYNYLPIK